MSFLRHAARKPRLVEALPSEVRIMDGQVWFSGPTVAGYLADCGADVSRFIDDCNALRRGQTQAWRAGGVNVVDADTGPPHL